jgi:hypothetical protein
MSIQNARFIGKYQRPDPKRTFKVYVGTESATGAKVHFTNPNGSPVPIPPEEFRKWRKIRPAG